MVSIPIPESGISGVEIAPKFKDGVGVRGSVLVLLRGDADVLEIIIGEFLPEPVEKFEIGSIELRISKTES